MKLETLQGIDPRLRTFLLLVVGLSYPAWDVGFELGAFGEIFFSKIFAAWATSAALLVTFLTVRAFRSMVPPLGWIAMATPSVWLLFLLVFRSLPTHGTVDLILLWLGILSYVACFPYMLYLGISVAYPDLLSVRDPRAKLLVVLLIALLLGTGFGAGTHHRWLLTCHDFEITGNYVPLDCRPEGELPLER